MLRPISVDFCLTFDADYRNIMLPPISVDFCLRDHSYITSALVGGEGGSENANFC